MQIITPKKKLERLKKERLNLAKKFKKVDKECTELEVKIKSNITKALDIKI